MSDEYRSRKWPWEPRHDPSVLFALGWMAVGGILTLVGGAILVFGGAVIGILTGLIPDFEAVPGEDLSWRSRDFLEDRKLIEEGEVLIYFDSIGPEDHSHDGSFFTDRRVVRYHEDSAAKGGLFVRSLDYADIESIDPVFGRGDDALTVIRITPRKGEAFDLLVGNEEKADREFVKRLQETWNGGRVPDGSAEEK